MARPEHKKDFRALLRDLARQGWQVRETRRGHFQVLPPNSSTVLIVGGSGDWRALRTRSACCAETARRCDDGRR
jgi:hypothetical protein